VTVLQLAMAYAALANGGKLYVPQIIREVRNASGETMFSYEPQFRQIAASSESLQIMHEGMDLVVNAVGGTAFEYARSDKVRFAGKTGTAQVRRKKRKQVVEVKGWHPSRDHAWFAGYAPADDPEIAVVVLVEHGGPGGKVAGPIAREILEAYFEIVAPRAEATP
jgi:penicillin-binding protein 2